MSWNIWSEYLTPDSSSDHSTDVPASCYRGKRFRERKCTENPDLFGANCRSAPNCLMLNDVKSCCFCDSELAKLHITFSIEDNDIPHEIEWEDRTEYQTDNISSCGKLKTIFIIFKKVCLRLHSQKTSCPIACG